MQALDANWSGYEVMRQEFPQCTEVRQRRRLRR